MTLFIALRQHLLRVFGFPGGYADELYPLVGEHDDLQGQNYAEYAERRKSSVDPKVGETRRRPERTDPEQDDHESDYDQGDDRDHFDQGEPELQFAEDLHRDHVRPIEHNQRDQRRYPLRNAGEPVVDIDGHGGDLRHPDHHPHEPIRPAGGKPCERADEFSRRKLAKDPETGRYSSSSPSARMIKKITTPPTA